MTCPECGHALDLHGPDGCLCTTPSKVGHSYNDRPEPCACTTPGRQLALDLT